MKQVNMEDMLNLWLGRYHNTTIAEVKKKHPKWAKAEKKYDEMKKNEKVYTEEERIKISSALNNASREFYREYAVTQEQHDDWEKLAKELVRKTTKLPKKIIERSWWSVYLDCAPSIKEERR